MIAQHFDIIWTYINNLTSTKTREEHPKDGMPNDLLYHVASSMGFNLLNGNSAKELWRYALGVDSDGIAAQDATVTGIASLSNNNITKEIWRRIVNNLPYILKSKGTSRSVKALLTCFGIPSTVLTIKEYGGPSTFTDEDHFPEYVHDVYHKAWNANGSCQLQLPGLNFDNSTGTLVTPNTLEFTFKTDNNYIYNYGVNYKLASSGDSDLYLSRQNSSTNLGKIILKNFNSDIIEIENLEIFDNSWHLLTLDQTTGTTTIKVTKTLYSKKIYIQSESAAHTAPFFDNNPIYFASGSSSQQPFIGHLHEIRLWSGSLNDATLIEHSNSPNTYTYNVDIYALHTGLEAADPYKHLLQRFTLSNNNFTNGNYLYSAHPNQTINNNGYIYVNNPNNFILEGFEQTYYTPSPSLGGSSLYTNKVRIESSSLDPNRRLNTKTRIEKSSYDRYSLDSNKVGVYFSPQTQINNDIFNQLGYFEIDDYIGDPGDTYKEKYPALINFATQYWKKYENRNDFEAYFRALEIYDFTLFKYIKQLLPYRANAILGLVVEPNVLERSRVRLNQKPIIEDLTQFADIDVESKLPMHLEIENIDALIDNKQRPDLEYDANKLAELSYAKVTPDLEYDANRLAELSYNQLKTELEYDDNRLAELSYNQLKTDLEYDDSKLAELSYNQLKTDLEYDDNKLADLDYAVVKPDLEYDDNKLGYFDSEIQPVTNFEYDVDKLSIIDPKPDFDNEVIDINSTSIDPKPVFDNEVISVNGTTINSTAIGIDTPTTIIQNFKYSVGYNYDILGNLQPTNPNIDDTDIIDTKYGILKTNDSLEGKAIEQNQGSIIVDNILKIAPVDIIDGALKTNDSLEGKAIEQNQGSIDNNDIVKIALVDVIDNEYGILKTNDNLEGKTIEQNQGSIIVDDIVNIALVDVIDNEYGILKNNDRLEGKTIEQNQGSIIVDNIVKIAPIDVIDNTENQGYISINNIVKIAPVDIIDNTENQGYIDNNDIVKIAPVEVIDNRGYINNNDIFKIAPVEVIDSTENQGYIYVDNLFSIISNKSVALNSTINTDINNIDKLGTSWSHTRNIGMYRLSESGSFNTQQPIVLESRKSFYSYTSNYFYSSDLSASLKLPYSQSYVPSDIIHNRGTGWQNARYAGSKLTAPGININTPTTVDGGPVVKITNVSPNQIIIRTGEVIVE